MLMKKITAILAVFCLVLGLCASVSAEGSAALTGSWRVCGGTDAYDTLVFHDDGTMEAYDYLDFYKPSEKGLLIFSGAYSIDETKITLPDGSIDLLEKRPATAEDDLTIGNTLYTVEPGDQLLFLTGEKSEEMQRFGIYVKDYTYPGFPAEEYLMNRQWLLDGKPFSFSEDMIDNGRLLYEGAYYSLQCRVLPIPEDMPGDELDKLGNEEMLLSDNPETGAMTLYMSEKEIIAYPLKDGTPLVFTMAD